MAVNGAVRSPQAIQNLHGILVEDINGHKFQLEKYKGKVIFIVNIASFGDDSTKVLNQMNSIQSKYPETVAVLGFPCNQFDHKENGDGYEILKTMQHLRPGHGFHPVFNLFQKVEVNGQHSHALFKHLREALPLPSDDLHSFIDTASRATWSPICRNDIATNFEKFIVAPNGKPYRRYSSKIQVTNIQSDIRYLLEKFNLQT